MKIKKNEIEYVSYSDLRGMGFSERMVKELLPHPVYDDNPMYKGAKPMKLYPVEIVHAVMGTEIYKRELDKRKSRIEGANKAISTKKDNMSALIKESISDLKITIILKSDLERRTLEEKYVFLVNSGLYETDPYYEDDDVKLGWMIEYVRKYLSNYGRILSKLSRHVGIKEAERQLEEAFLNRFYESYPMFKSSS